MLPPRPEVPPACDAGALWDFALALYGRPGVDEACIALQDRHGADVVLLLGLLWLAHTTGRRADEADIAALDSALADWRAMAIAPLRDVRRALKPRLAGLPPEAAALRESVKRAELDAERIAFALLAAAIARLPAAPVGEERRLAARGSLARSLGRPGATQDGALPAPAEILLAAFDALPPPNRTR